MLYYWEKTGDSKRPSLRVVAVEDLRETLMSVHEQVYHGGRTRMTKYLVEHGRLWQSRASTSDTALPRSLQICQATNGGRAHRRLYTSPSSQTPLGNADRQT